MRVFALVDSRLEPHKQGALRYLLEAPDIQVVGACIHSHPEVSGLVKIRRELHRGRGGYVAIQILKVLARRWHNKAVDSEAFFARYGVWTLRCPDLYTQQTLDAIRDRRPDVLFRAGFGIIREPVLSLARYGILSYHHGNMRRYRGQPPAFWELYHGEREMYVTVQVLSARLDAGLIAKEIAVPIYLHDTWGRLLSRAHAMSERLALEATRALVTPGAVMKELSKEELGPLYTTPNLRQWLTLQARVVKRMVMAHVGRRILKCPQL
jgi:methionyl-tRNA formyltransferase